MLFRVAQNIGDMHLYSDNLNWNLPHWGDPRYKRNDGYINALHNREKEMNRVGQA